MRTSCPWHLKIRNTGFLTEKYMKTPIDIISG